MIDRWSAIVAHRARWVLVVGLLLVAVAGGYGAGVFDSLSRGGFDDPSAEGYQELEAEREIFGNQSVDVVAIYSSDELTADQRAFRDAVTEVVESLPTDAVATVTPYYDAPPEAGLVTADGHRAQVLISLAGATQDDFLDAYDEIEPDLHAGGGLTTDLAGTYAVYTDVNEITAEDLERAELLSLPLVIVLALLIFGSLVAATMPALVGVVALIGGLAVVRLLTTVTDVSVFAVNVISLLGIGLAIDYALFIISRFREELDVLPEGPEASRIAVRRTLATAGRTVLFSGLTVAAALASLLIFPQMFLRSMGYGGMAAVLIAMLAALTVLPAALVLLGRRVDAGRMPWRRNRPVGVADAHGRWAALARGVMRRPVLVLAATAVVLLAVASPFLGVKWGSVDHRVLPDDAPAHIAAERLADFGPETASANSLLQGVDQAGVNDYLRAVDDLPAETTSTVVARDGDDTLIRTTWTGNSQTEASQDLVRDLRAIDPDQGTVLVGGLTADTVDLLASVGDHLPWMGLIVVGVMLVLLFVAFGSVVLPIKAVVMNAFSITASFGVITWIFSDGHLADLIGFTPQGFLDATNPILMLAILFGLSMDYEVFLLSRIREQWDHATAADPTLPASVRNDRAVATGVQKTGRIITSAALLLAVVIGAFSTSGIVFMKMLGIGMLVAILIDATVVRALMVPATMKLLGGWNWWAPGPLRRWWERYGFREEPPAVREPAPVTAPSGSASM